MATSAKADRLRAGVVGVGYLGALHASKYHELDDADLVAVFDIDRPRAGEVARRYGCVATATLGELLDRVDVASIAVPTAAHAEVAVRVAEAGVSMLIEKPLAGSLAEGERIAEAARAAGVAVQVGHLERYNPVFDELRRVLDRPRFVECHRLSPYAGRGGDTNVVYDVMIHDLDLLAHVVGQEVAGVEAIGVPVLSSHVDIANARLRFEGGCIANVTASRVSLKRERKLRVFQPDAYVSIDFDKRRVVIAQRREPESGAQSPMAAIAVDEHELGEADPLASEIAAFVAAVREGKRPQVGLREGLAALRLADRVVAAMDVPEER